MLNFDPLWLEEIEKALDVYTQSDQALHETLFSSMRYSLQSGGKRLRPMLVLSFCDLCGGAWREALPFACAIEMIHTYSLIHDDLPSMDNDDLRRGKPTNHKVFGEGLAVIAGDALQALAFDVMLRKETIEACGAGKAAQAAGILARACGVYGMCGGQAIDLASEGRRIDEETLREMDREKTGALIKAAALMGCALGGANQAQREAAEEYASAVGLAFQIVDDLLDVNGDEKTVGKTLRSDAANEKSTYVSLLGEDGARKEAAALTARATEALKLFGDGAEPLKELARQLAVRTY